MIFEIVEIFMKNGKVYLVGAGPGDPKLITLKALNIIKKADVVIYDRLISKALIKWIPRKAEKIYVGKHVGNHTVSQDRIQRLMVEKARDGKMVVRLKGGDPFLFGRGGEEAEDLFMEDIKFEVVPGITPALAAPAYAGIPVSHREYASSVALVTGHEHGKNIARVDWKKLATAVDTIVILMGVKRFKFIIRDLLKGGLSDKTPVAFIQWGTTTNQKIVSGILADIIDRAKEEKIGPPAIIVIGEVVKLQKRLSWFSGRKIVT
jgi:uroporphyrinogen III methyltransferase/synthase